MRIYIVYTTLQARRPRGATPSAAETGHVYTCLAPTSHFAGIPANQSYCRSKRTSTIYYLRSVRYVIKLHVSRHSPLAAEGVAYYVHVALRPAHAHATRRAHTYLFGDAVAAHS